MSTGLLFIKEQRSELPAVPLAPSGQYSKLMPSPSVKTLSDNRWIEAGASFSSNPMANTSPWPAPPGFGPGVMVISQGLGGAMSMWLPDLMEYQFSPMVDVGIGYPEHPAVVDLTLQSDDPYIGRKPEDKLKNWQIEQDQVEKDQEKTAKMGEGKAYFDAVHAEDLAMLNFKDVAQLYEVQREPFVPENVQPKPSQMVSDVSPSSDLSSFPGTSSSLDKVTNGTDDEGEVFKRAEIVFKNGKDDTFEPVHYSKLSLNQAPDGSSSLLYEEQKRSSLKDVMKSQKDDKVFGIKDLVSSLLDLLRSVG